MRFLLATSTFLSLTASLAAASEPGSVPAIPEISWEMLRLPGKFEGDFSLEKLPERIRKLDGKKVRIRGYIHRGAVSKETNRFFLIKEGFHNGRVRESLDELIDIRVKDWSQFKITTRPISIVGTLRLRPRRSPETGKLGLIYYLDADSIHLPPHSRRSLRDRSVFAVRVALLAWWLM